MSSDKFGEIVMLTLQKSQLAALRKSRIEAFVGRTLVHLGKYFPRHLIAFGVEPLRKLIEIGLSKSSDLGIRWEACVRTYIELTVLLGAGFHDDPLTPWASRILSRGNTGGLSDENEMARGDRLHAEAWNFIDACRLDLRESGGNLLTRFQAEISQVKGIGSTTPTNSQQVELLRSVVNRLRLNFPSKCLYVGEERAVVQVSSALEKARAFNIETVRGLATFATLGFVLGHDFMNDPLHAWASSLLRSQASEDSRIDAVLSQGSAILDIWWHGKPAAGES